MGERIHGVLAFVAVTIVVAGILGWRSLGGADPKRGAPVAAVPAPQLTELIPFSAPLSDTLAFAPRGSDSIVLQRDPFGAVVPRTVEAPSSVDVARPTKSAGEQWRVSAILMSGTRRAAIINDALIYVGDPVPGGGTLTSVERDRIVVKDPKGASHTVAVKEGNG